MDVPAFVLNKELREAVLRVASKEMYECELDSVRAVNNRLISVQAAYLLSLPRKRTAEDHLALFALAFDPGRFDKERDQHRW